MGARGGRVRFWSMWLWLAYLGPCWPPGSYRRNPCRTMNVARMGVSVGVLESGWGVDSNDLNSRENEVRSRVPGGEQDWGVGGTLTGLEVQLKLRILNFWEQITYKTRYLSSRWWGVPEEKKTFLSFWKCTLHFPGKIYRDQIKNNKTPDTYPFGMIKVWSQGKEPCTATGQVYI